MWLNSSYNVVKRKMNHQACAGVNNTACTDKYVGESARTRSAASSTAPEPSPYLIWCWYDIPSYYLQLKFERFSGSNVLKMFLNFCFVFVRDGIHYVADYNSTLMGVVVIVDGFPKLKRASI